MPLHILLILVIGGIAGIALALHVLGLSRRRVLESGTLVRDWHRHFPGDSFDGPQNGDTLVTRNGDRAILHPDQGPGLLWVMGADTAARRLAGASWHKTRNGDMCRFDDPGAPRVKITLKDPAERHQWVSYLENMHGL